MSKKAKPSSPAEALRKAAERRANAFAAVNLSPELSELLSGADIEVTRSGDKRGGQTVKEDSARRLDAFSALKDGMDKGAYDAARRYEHQLLVRRGENDRGPSRERVDQTAGFTTDAMIDAADWLEKVGAMLSRRDFWLLVELLSPTRERPTWRDTVFYVTGETHTHAQGSAVRSMTVNLRDAIEVVDKARAEKPRKAA